MGKINFSAFGYWDKTMKVEDVATDEQFQTVIDFCNSLNVKYALENGCAIHPEENHTLTVYFSDGFKDFQISRRDTCNCPIIHKRLIEIRNHEMILNNPTHFKHPTE